MGTILGPGQRRRPRREQHRCLLPRNAGDVRSSVQPTATAAVSGVLPTEAAAAGVLRATASMGIPAAAGAV